MLPFRPSKEGRVTKEEEDKADVRRRLSTAAAAALVAPISSPETRLLLALLALLSAWLFLTAVVADDRVGVVRVSDSSEPLRSIPGLTGVLAADLWRLWRCKSGDRGFPGVSGPSAEPRLLVKLRAKMKS